MNNDSGSDNDPGRTTSESGQQSDLPDISTSENLEARVEHIALASLDSRINRVSSTLDETLQNLVSLHALNLCEERDYNQLGTELSNWETMITELESVLGWLTTKDGQREPTIGGYELPKIKPAENILKTDAGLQKSINSQQQRIRELEQQLLKLGELQQTEANDESPYVNRIILTTNGHENFKFPLTRSIMTIGREARNDIYIPSRFISRFHARIVSDAQGSIIEDLESSNGVKVNSGRIRRKQLRSGDLIDLGRTQLKFIDLMERSSSEGSA